jgi:hypothetical protein
MGRIRREVTVPRNLVQEPERRNEGHKVAQLGDVIDAAHIRRSCDLGGILFISIEFGVDVFRDLWEGVRSVFRPEEVLCVEVYAFFCGNATVTRFNFISRQTETRA